MFGVGLSIGSAAIHRRRAEQPASLVSGLVTPGDMSIAITNPSALTVPMVTNGRVLKIVTTGTLATGALDLSKVTLTVVDQGWDAAGAQVARGRTIGCREFLRGPYAETGYHQPVPGTFHVVLDDHLYNQDATWRTTIQSVNFAGGWLPGAAAETITAVTREDSLPYFAFPMKALHLPFERVAASETFPASFTAIDRFARNRSQLACVEAWAVDGAGTAGPVARASSFARSALTPASGNMPGPPAPAYEVGVAMTGLAQGRVGIRARFKPWIGPAVESFAWGDDFGTMNLSKETPACLDLDSSYAPLFGVLAHDPAAPPSGKTVIASNTTVSTADVSGLATSQAAALASGKVYANWASLLAAVNRVNASASALTLASGSYQRATVHNDTAGAVGLCPPVTGSALGQDAGAYSIRVSAATVGGLTLPELRSVSGLPSADVRWRSQNSEGGATAAKGCSTRLKLRGLTLDSTGLATAADNTVFSMGSSPTSAEAELATRCLAMVDCEVYETRATNPSAAVAIVGAGAAWYHRVKWDGIPNVASISSGTAGYSGMVAAVGSSFTGRTGGAVSLPLTCLAGVKLTDIQLGGQALGGAQPDTWGQLAYNVRVTTLGVSVATEIVASPSSRRAYKGCGYCMVFADAPNATSFGGPIFRLYGDGSRILVDSLVMQHVGTDAPLLTNPSDARLNIGYNDQNAIRINSNVAILYSAVRSYNVKGDDFLAPESFPTTAHDPALAYNFGNIRVSGGITYQAIRNVPANTAISDATYWYNTGAASGASIGKRSERQGNADLRYHVGSRGNVASSTASGEATPGVQSTWGLKWGPDETTTAIYADFYVDRAAGDYRAKAGGPLLNRVAAGRAVTPFYIEGTAMANDGTAPAGAWPPFS